MHCIEWKFQNKFWNVVSYAQEKGSRDNFESNKIRDDFDIVYHASFQDVIAMSTKKKVSLLFASKTIQTYNGYSSRVYVKILIRIADGFA